MGIVNPLVVGFLVRGNDFSSALLFVGGMALLSIVSWTVIIGKVDQIRLAASISHKKAEPYRASGAREDPIRRHLCDRFTER
jgi:hypothetical protein